MKTTYETQFKVTIIYNGTFKEENVIGTWAYLKFHATTHSAMHNFKSVDIMDEYTGEILMQLEG